MANILVRLTRATESTASMLLWADTDGTYAVTANGVTQNVAIAAATNYGTGFVEFTGLASNSHIPYSVSLSGVVQGAGNLRTNPGEDDSFYVGFGGCMLYLADPVALYRLVDVYDIRAFFSIGDMPYNDEAVTLSSGYSRWGTTQAILGTYQSTGTVTAWHLGFLYAYKDIPAIRYLSERVPTYMMWDDHQLCNDYDHKLANINATYTAGGYSTFANQAAVDAFFALGQQAWRVWSAGNPANASPLKTAWKPANADAGTSSAGYTGEYFSVDIGPAKFVVPDYITHRSGTDDADAGTLIENSSTAKTMLGRPQMKWLKHTLASSTKSFNPIMSTKVTYIGNAANNNHGYNDCVTERNHIIDWIAKNARGVIWGASDVHTPHVISNEQHGLMCATPLGQAEQDGTSSVDLGAGYIDSIAWKASGYAAGRSRNFRAVGVVHVTPTHMDWIIMDDCGAERTRWRQYKNCNTFSRIV